MFTALFFALFLLSACNPQKTEQGREGATMGDAAAAEVHIRTGPRVEYYLNKEANDLTEITVRETFERWGEVTHFDFVYMGRHRAGLRKDGKNCVSFLVKWPPEVPIGKVGYCRNWYDRKGNIIESDIIFNMMIARFTTLRTNMPDAYYIEGVLAHEIGHMIGLGHIASDSSLMKQLSPLEESYFMGRIDAETLEQYKKLYSSAQ
jgi:Zn-dependent protease with chaperone function